MTAPPGSTRPASSAQPTKTQERGGRSQRRDVVTVLEHLSPETLRDLAGAITARRSSTIARRRLSPEGVDKLADILLSGTTPTIGFFRRNWRTES